jgi:hypothetical protein
MHMTCTVANPILEEARCHRWRAMLLDHEILELGGVMGTAIDGGVPRAAMTRADDLLFESRKYLDRDELDRAEELRRRAESEIIARKAVRA